MDIPPSPLFPPSYILVRLSLMSQLATLRIHFHSPHPNRDVETPEVTNVMLPNLQVFSYRGVSAYLEGLARIRAPTLKVLDVQLFNQLTFTVPWLLEFMRASEFLRFSAVKITFDGDSLGLMAGPDSSWQQRSLRLQIMCKQLDWQVASTVQTSIQFPLNSLVWKSSYSSTGYTIDRQTRTTKSTESSGASFFGRSAA
ncbi:hypothetical protein BGW80DRAFT_918068 [Lactifluus volemus]|nr:hypothetical protein BGW80DRAFT_918068 [Lactifluus volemus]